jgi:hypothetical protein
MLEDFSESVTILCNFPEELGLGETPIFKLKEYCNKFLLLKPETFGCTIPSRRFEILDAVSTSCEIKYGSLKKAQISLNKTARGTPSYNLVEETKLVARFRNIMQQF